MTVIAPYAAFLGLMHVALSLNVIRIRRSSNIGLNHKDQPQLERAIRAQGNFSEYVPLALILIFLAQLSVSLTHILGLVLVLSRLVHAYSILHKETQNPPVYGFRVLGMMLTFSVIISCSLRILIRSLF